MKTNHLTPFWIALIRTQGVGSITGQFLLKKFKSIEEIFSTSEKNLKEIGLRVGSIKNIINPSWNLIEKDILWLENKNHHLLTIQDDLYPALLKEIPNPPLAIFVKGDPKILSNSQIGIIGSRNPSWAGKGNAYNFAKYLVENNFTITSGFAYGIDTESHKSAIENNGKTIAIMGTGLNETYPKENEALAEKILDKGGSLVSEFGTDTKVKAKNFPKRNRIISGLSLGILVVEANIRSGSLITARAAIEQGREVFAIPGSIHSPLSKGCHYLIQQGAKLTEKGEDILEELYPLNSSNNLCDKKMRENKKKSKNTLDSDEEKLLDCVDFEVTSMDELKRRSAFSTSEIVRTTLLLELKGYIKSMYGGYVKLKTNIER